MMFMKQKRKGLDRTTTKKITVKKKPAPKTKTKPIPIPKKAQKVIKKDLKEEVLEEPTNEIIEEEPEPEALFDEESEEDEEEELLLTPALAADEEIIEETPSEVSADFSAPEEPVDQLEKMRADFQEREQSLLDEIATLKEEIESLKSKL